MPEAWEVKLNEFYKLLEQHDKASKQGTDQQSEPKAQQKINIESKIQAQPQAQPSAAQNPNPWPPKVPGLPRHDEPAQEQTEISPQLVGVRPAESKAAENIPAPPPAETADAEAVETAAVASDSRNETLDYTLSAPKQPEAQQTSSSEQSCSSVTSSPEPQSASAVPAGQLDLNLPKLEDYIPFLREADENVKTEPSAEPPSQQVEQKAAEQKPIESPIEEPKPEPVISEAKKPAPKQHKKPENANSTSAVDAAWDRLPKHVQNMMGEIGRETAQRYYSKGFKESRDQLLKRLLDPPLTLEETARILNVCPMTVRRYTNRGILPHFRTVGNQRRFRLSDVLGFLESRSGKSSDMSANA